MKTSAEHKAEGSAAILLIAPPGGGKSTLLSSIPGMYIADCDNNLGGPVKYQNTIGHNNFFYDTINVDDSGKEVPTFERWGRLCLCVAEAAKNPAVRAIGIDSLTIVCEYLMDYLIKKNGRTNGLMQIQDWGEFKTSLVRLFVACRAKGKPFFCTAHERYDKDEMTGVLQFRINIPGQTADIIGAYFSDVWRLHSETQGNDSKRAYFIRTANNARTTGLKESLGMPIIKEANHAEIVKMLGLDKPLPSAEPQPQTEIKDTAA